MEIRDIYSATETLELKFNMLLLLRNLYIEGLPAARVKEEYRKYFGKEINGEVFDPVARNPLKSNRQFMQEDIKVFQKDEQHFFAAKKCCSKEEMQFLVNAVYFYKNCNSDTVNNYVSVRSEMSEKHYYNENVEKYEFSTSVEELDQKDPLAEAIPENEGKDDTIKEESHSSVEVIDIDDDDSTEMKSKEFLESNDIRESNSLHQNQAMSRVQVDSPGLPLSFWISSQNSEMIPPVTDTNDKLGHYNIVLNPENHYLNSSTDFLNSSTDLLTPTIVSVTSVPSNKGLQSANTRKQIIVPSKASDIAMFCSHKGCGRPFASAWALKTHINSAHTSKTVFVLKCPADKCSKIFQDKQELKVHKDNCQIFANYQSKFPCPVKNCNKSFGKSQHLQRHRDSHHLQEFKCSGPNCVMSFKQANFLKIHEKRCQFKYACPVKNCNKSFGKLQQLQRHRDSHQNLQEFKCSVPNCVMSFKQANFLKTHENRCRFKYEVLKSMQEEENNTK